MATNETVEHLKYKYYWFEKLTKHGYECEFEKTLKHPKRTNDSTRVDVYAENETKIIAVEVIHTSWSGKNPQDYLSKSQQLKEFEFIKQPATPDSKIDVSKVRNKIIINAEVSKKIYQKLKNTSEYYDVSMARIVRTLIANHIDNIPDYFVDQKEILRIAKEREAREERDRRFKEVMGNLSKRKTDDVDRVKPYSEEDIHRLFCEAMGNKS